MKLTTCILLVPRLRMSGAMPLFLPYAFMMWTGKLCLNLVYTESVLFNQCSKNKFPEATHDCCRNNGQDGWIRNINVVFVQINKHFLYFHYMMILT